MLNYTKIANKPRIFQSLTSLTLTAFNHLLSAFGQAEEQAWQKQEAQRRTPRQRQQDGGRKPTLLSLEDKLVFILFYFRIYPTQEVLGFLFGLSQSQANEWIHRLTPC